MLIYIITALLLLILCRRNAKLTFLIGCLILILLSSIRASTVGFDLENYISIFKNTYKIVQPIEFGFIILTKLLYAINSGTQFFIISTTLLSLIPIFYVIWQSSTNKSISLLIFLLLLHYFFTLSGIRQSISISFVFLAIYFLHEKKLLKYGICIAIASSIHFSSILYLLISLFIYKIKIQNKFALYSIVITAAISIFINLGWILKSIPFKNEILIYYQLYGDTNPDIAPSVSRILVNVIPNSILAFIFYHKNTDNNIYLKIFYIGVILNNLLISLPIGFRISKAALLFSILLIPYYFSNYRHSKLYYLAFITYSLFLFNYNIIARYKTGANNDIVPYKFYFEK